MKLGPYALEGGLGQGAAALVYRARGPDGRRVAVKVLKRAYDPIALARFERERQVMASLGEEDGFVPLLDWGVSTKGPYLVMPLLEGGTLRARLDRGRLDVPDTLALGRALAWAVGAAHALGVAHRDLKPENVLFADDGSPLIADLGLAKRFDGGGHPDESFCVSRTGAFTGTAGYAAPEQVLDAKNVGPPADVFALGAILHECLAGEPAYTAPDLLSVLRRVCAGPPAPLLSKRPDAPRWLVSVIEMALAKEPAERFADADELLAALDAEEWGLEAGKRVKRERIVKKPRAPLPIDELDVPPSTAVHTEILDDSPIDAANIVADKPDDAPQTLVIQDIPFTVEKPREKPRPVSARVPASPTETAAAPSAPPIARWPLVVILGLLGAAIVLSIVAYLVT